MISILAPGQGSQAPGFLYPWLEIEYFAEKLQELSEYISLDLATLGTTSDADEIKDTSIAQPLIVSASIACFELLRKQFGESLEFSATCGHSVGEITAGYVSGVLDAESAAKLVAIRGREMAKAATEASSAMAAVVGGEEVQVLDYLNQMGLTAANYNGPGQIVAAGPSELISKLVQTPPAGSRVVQLAVAGAFHTEFMSAAVEALEKFSKSLEPKDPNILIWTNRDGSKVTTGADYLRLLVAQVSSPVRWDLTMKSMQAAGVTALIELLPGGVLSGIAKRAMPGVATVAIKTPGDLDKVAKLLEEQK